MDPSRFSISPRDLYDRLGSASAPTAINVRKPPASDADDRMLAHAMLEQSMVVYDALYAWCRSFQTEPHGRKPPF